MVASGLIPGFLRSASCLWKLVCPLSKCNNLGTLGQHNYCLWWPPYPPYPKLSTQECHEVLLLECGVELGLWRFAGRPLAIRTRNPGSHRDLTQQLDRSLRSPELTGARASTRPRRSNIDCVSICMSILYSYYISMLYLCIYV